MAVAFFFSIFQEVMYQPRKLNGCTDDGDNDIDQIEHLKHTSFLQTILMDITSNHGGE